MIHLLRAGALALALFSCAPQAATAQSGPPRYTTLADGGRKETTPTATFCSTDNGATWTPCSGGGGGGSGVDPRVAQGSSTTGQTGILTQGAVVTGDQAWAAGETRPYTLTPQGRLKVGLSSATNIEPAAQLTTTIAADLVACKNRASSAMAVGTTAAIGCDAYGNQLVATAPTRATSTSGGGSVTTAGTYQSALAANPARLDCLIQNTSTSTLRVYVGAPGSATDSAAFQIAAGGSFGCGSGTGVALTDAISITSAVAGATYVVVSQ